MCLSLLYLDKRCPSALLKYHFKSQKEGEGTMEIITGVSVTLLFFVLALSFIKPKKRSFSEQDVMYRPSITEKHSHKSLKS